MQQIARDNINARYLPEGPFPPLLTAHENLTEALDGIDEVLVSVPSHALRDMLQQLRGVAGDLERVAWATKGLELSTGKLPHQVVTEELGADGQYAVLSGPTFAKELARGLPTALPIGSNADAFAQSLAARVSDENFRAYTSDDVVGVEVGGAVKNVMAIGAGMSDGLGFGSNSRVALITRGLNEMTRFGVAMGANRETFMGLAGMGDLVLTCTDNQSRNRRMGLALADGKSIKEAEAEIQQVVEGVLAAKAVKQAADNLGVEMPITEQIYRILYEGIAPLDALKALMQRAPGREID